MTVHSQGPSLPTSRPVAGVLSITLAMFIFAAQDVAMKELIKDVTVWTLIGVRGAISAALLIPLILILGAPHRLTTPLWPLHALRGFLFALGFSLFFAAFPFMKLTEVSTIFFAAPLFTALIAAVFLGEQIGLHRKGCLIVGFAGVLVAMNPTSDTFQWVALLPLITAATYASSQVLARRIGDRETSLTVGLYTLAFSGILIVPLAAVATTLLGPVEEFRHLRWEWRIPLEHLLFTIFGVGVLGMIGYILSSRAYQIAEASIVAPFDYTYLPFAALLSYAVWRETPEWNTLLGMVMIIGSGLYLGWRELRQSRLKLDPAPTAEIAFTPSAPIGHIAHTADAKERG